jgi:hypothetical protein
VVDVRDADADQAPVLVVEDRAGRAASDLTQCFVGSNRGRLGGRRRGVRLAAGPSLLVREAATSPTPPLPFRRT